MFTPTLISFLSDVETPVSLFHKISDDETMAFLFESTDGDSRLARYSFIGVFPRKILTFKDGLARMIDTRQGTEQELSFTNPLDLMREEIEAFNQALAPFSPADTDLPFTGGWVGYMGYGSTRYFDGIPQQDVDPLAVPEGYYGLYDTVVLYDHLFRRITFLSYRPEAEALDLWNTLQRRLAETAPLPPLFVSDVMSDEEIFEGITGPFDRKRFCDTVLTAKSFIQEGQIFQIVLSQRFSLPFEGPALNLYRTLQAINPSPYGYFLKFPEFVYLGSSPETFVSCQNGKVTLRALAGTRPRGATAETDKLLADELRANEKELAEHHMLVDLGRNDLGRFCQPGSIQVGEIGTITRYTHVMHLATELTGQLLPEKTAFDVMKSCFPRGTVSGAPKIRAMNLLSKLEPERRGVYSGVVGYFDFAGNMDGAIAIRSALIKEGVAHVNAGAGVVYDSDPGAEYEETQNKAKSVLKAIKLSERATAKSLERI